MRHARKGNLSGPIVVGVDGTEQSDRAVRYAVTEARRRGVGVLLVHALHESAPMAAMLPLYSVESFAEVGRRLLTDAERLALELDPDVDASTLVKGGNRVAILVEAAGEHASGIVLGHRSRTRAQRVLTGSTTNGTASRAHVPVVSVPDGWPGEDRTGTVVVGVDDSEASHDALEAGFEEARLRGARLVAVHSWRLPSAYDEVSYSQAAVDGWLGAAREELAKAVAPFAEAFPEVEVTVDVRHEHVGQGLVSAAGEADLIVVGRRGRGAPLGLHLGSIPRMLISEAPCPVMVVPQHPRHTPTAEERLPLRSEEVLPET